MKQLFRNFFLFLPAIIFFCACNNSSHKDNADVEATTTKTNSAADSLTTFYLGGTNAWGQAGFDHCYVSNYSPVDSCKYDSDSLKQYYWCCLGGCHLWPSTPTNGYDGWLIASQPGNLSLAKRLVNPKYCRDNIAWTEGGTGGMAAPYGANGVCQTIANRVLYSTYWSGSNSPAVAPLTIPDSTGGYRIAHFFYGTYGQDYQNFKLRIAQMGGDSSFVGNNGDSLEINWLKSVMGSQYTQTAWDEFQVLRLALQLAIHEYAIAENGNSDSKSFAELMNKKATALLQNKMLPFFKTEEAYTKMFGSAPGKPVTLIHLHQ